MLNRKPLLGSVRKQNVTLFLNICALNPATKERGVRLKIGYVAKKASDGPKVRDYQPPSWLLAKNMERTPGEM